MQQEAQYFVEQLLVNASAEDKRAYFEAEVDLRQLKAYYEENNISLPKPIVDYYPEAPPLPTPEALSQPSLEHIQRTDLPMNKQIKNKSPKKRVTRIKRVIETAVDKISLDKSEIEFDQSALKRILNFHKPQPIQCQISAIDSQPSKDEISKNNVRTHWRIPFLPKSRPLHFPSYMHGGLMKAKNLDVGQSELSPLWQSLIVKVNASIKDRHCHQTKRMLSKNPDPEIDTSQKLRSSSINSISGDFVAGRRVIWDKSSTLRHKPQTALIMRPNYAKKKSKARPHSAIVSMVSVKHETSTSPDIPEQHHERLLELFDWNNGTPSRKGKDCLSIVKSMGLQEGTPGFSRYVTLAAGNNDWEWLPCLVLDHKVSQNLYLICWPNGGQKWVNRLNLRFALETEIEYFNRIAQAKRSLTQIDAEKDEESKIINFKTKPMALLPETLKLGALSRIGRKIVMKDMHVLVKIV